MAKADLIINALGTRTNNLRLDLDGEFNGRGTSLDFEVQT
jgi:hypothetical protein